MLENNKLGKLYVFEGPDGVGKTTICENILKLFNNNKLDIISLSFPGKEESTLGKLVYDIHHERLTDKVQKLTPTALQTLHIAAHIDCIETIIKPAIREGKIVLLDRFWWSTYVYGKYNHINEVTLKSMINLENSVWDPINPSILFLIQTERKIHDHENEILRKTLLNNLYVDLTESKLNSARTVIVENDDLNKTITEIYNLIQKDLETKKKIKIFTSLTPAKTTKVYDSYWLFAAKRQEIFFKRVNQSTPPWTEDPILLKYKFTNAYRASDRVSQYLIKNIIYFGNQEENEVFFRIMLFKVFNKIETWELLKSSLGEISIRNYNFKLYDKVLTQALESKKAIYSAAYIMPSGNGILKFSRKHQNHLKLIEMMIKNNVPKTISKLKKMHQVFELLLDYPTIGEFLAYQYTIDINYSNLTNFSEMEFVVPGPGAYEGIKKCFSDLGGLNETEIIKLVTERQEHEFNRLGIDFKSLWGRSLHLIDCQNLFCEIGKYARVAYPTFLYKNGRKKIKQIYKHNPSPIDYWYPPKWGINEKIKGK